MKIVRLKTAVVEGNFDWTFVRIDTDEAIRGLGECFFAPGLTSILHSLKPVVQGQDPLANASNAGRQEYTILHQRKHPNEDRSSH